jgi:hemerythrin superfamily protein
MNAIELLKTDHRKVEDLFKRAHQADPLAEKREIFMMIREELDLHTRVEETVFYPAFSQYESFDDLLDESYEEHQDIEDIVDELMRLEDPDDFQDLLEDLESEVEHHVHMEETQFFPKVRDVMTDEEIERLGMRVQDAKRAGTQRAA